jgi:hypothetical protein
MSSLVWASYVCVTFVVGGSLISCFDLSLPSKPKLFAPDGPLSQAVSNFPCIESLAASRQPKRIAMLHGPDWVLESAAAPSCLPEREVVFSTEAGKTSLPHSLTFRTRLWLKKNGEVICVRILESSGSEKQDMVAVDFATDHKCSSRTSKNCRVQGGAAPMKM